MSESRQIDDYRALTGSEKAAILLLAVGENSATKIFAMMDDEEIKELSLVMAGLGAVSAQVIEQLIGDFAAQMGQASHSGALRMRSRRVAGRGESAPKRASA
jgi:flagellar motor switch protein FliG